jgi:chromatin assembly factor 1 subunit A
MEGSFPHLARSPFFKTLMQGESTVISKKNGATTAATAGQAADETKKRKRAALASTQPKQEISTFDKYETPPKSPKLDQPSNETVMVDLASARKLQQQKLKEEDMRRKQAEKEEERQRRQKEKEEEKRKKQEAKQAEKKRKEEERLRLLGSLVMASEYALLSC